MSQIDYKKTEATAAETDHIGIGVDEAGVPYSIDDQGIKSPIGGGETIPPATDADMDAGTSDDVYVSPFKFVYGLVTKTFTELPTTSKSVIGSIIDLFNRLNNYPLMPTVPVGQFLKDDGTFADIEAGISSSNTNLYATDTDSDISGYKASSYAVEALEVDKIITASSADGIVYGEKYLYGQPYADTIINSGTWELHVYGNLNSAGGDTRIVLRAFERLDNGTEVELFTHESIEINATTVGTSIIMPYNSPAFTVSATSRIGYQIGLQTTSVASRTFTYIVGDGRGTHLNAPFALRHSQLRDLNGDDNYQHITTAEKTNLTLQGNTFNGASQLVQLDADGKLPAIDGSQLTNLPSGGTIDAEVIQNSLNAVSGGGVFSAITPITDRQAVVAISYDNLGGIMSPKALAIQMASDLTLSLDNTASNIVGTCNFFYINTNGGFALNIGAGIANYYPAEINGKVLDAGIYQILTMLEEDGISIQVPGITSTPVAPADDMLAIPSIITYLKGADATTVGDDGLGNPTWTDLVLGNVFTSAGGAHPVYDPADGSWFFGTDSFIRFFKAATPFNYSFQTGTIFMVVNRGYGDDNYIFGGSNHLLMRYNGLIIAQKNSETAWTSTTIPIGEQSGLKIIIALRGATGTDLEFWLNNVKRETKTGGIITASTIQYVGALNDTYATQYMRGKIYSIAAYNRNLTDAEMNTAFESLNSLYNVYA